MSLLDFLTDRGVVSRKDFHTLVAEVKAGTPLDEALAAQGISTDDLLEAKAEYFELPIRRLEGKEIPYDVLRYVPEESSGYYQFVPLGVADGALEVGIVDPDNLEARDALNFISTKANLPFKLYLISKEDFERVHALYRGLSGEVTKALSELETELASEEEIIAAEVPVLAGKGIEARIIEDAPVTKIVATILHYATEGEASDIHIEHMGDRVRVRFRVDGVLGTSLILPVKVHAAVVARIKILANLRLDEKRKPQDGRFSAKIAGRKIDFRVSTFPSYYGEKVVMRILDVEKGVRTLEGMGLSPRNLALIRDAFARPYGMILISGPTGSGKSTTLYGILSELDREKENVVSLEDPVEYSIEGVSQSQVRPEIGYSFASGIRSIVRQDPDIIMVGEIRDKETAQLAIQAALTGHLVLSTIHTNNAAGVIPRLIDMGVDPYLIAPTLILAMAQRLVQKICPRTGKAIPIEGSIKALIEREFEDLPPEHRRGISFPKEVLGISPTPDCPKGTRGRIGVFEILAMDKDLEAAILRRAGEADIRKIARKQGMFTMKEDAILKAFRKEIPFEEINKL